jgi:ABC-type antimicrobial peptide transport system permease subunit
MKIKINAKIILLLLSVIFCFSGVIYSIIDYTNDIKLIQNKNFFFSNDKIVVKKNNFELEEILEFKNKYKEFKQDYYYESMNLEIGKGLKLELKGDLIDKKVVNRYFPDVSKEEEFYKLQIVDGRDFTDEEINGLGNPIIISDYFSKIYFNNTNSIGKEIELFINNRIIFFVVVGVYESSLNMSINFSQYSEKLERFKTSLYIPIKTIEFYLNNTFSINKILFYSKNLNVEPLKKSLQSLNYFDIISWQTNNGKFNQETLDLKNRFTFLSIPLIGISFILFFVSFYFYYRNRSIEFGIRRVVGASIYDLTLMVGEENLLILFVGLVSSFFISVFVTILKLFSTYKYFLKTPFFLSLFDFFIPFILVFIFFLLLSIIEFFFHQKKQIGDYLKCD